MPSLTIENYVKTIYNLCLEQESGTASTGAIASSLKVSPGTVTSMMKTLNDSGLAHYTPYEGVRLTESGQALALRVLRRHRLIELFLVKTLGLSWDEVHEEAENMEHAVSDFLVDRIDSYLGHPETDPHGDPIPHADGTVATQDANRLTEWPAGRGFRLVRVVDQSPEFLRFLSHTGLAIGTEGHVSTSSPAAGTITLFIADQEMALGRDVAEKLMVTDA